MESYAKVAVAYTIRMIPHPTNTLWQGPSEESVAATFWFLVKEVGLARQKPQLRQH